LKAQKSPCLAARGLFVISYRLNYKLCSLLKNNNCCAGENCENCEYCDTSVAGVRSVVRNCRGFFYVNRGNFRSFVGSFIRSSVVRSSIIGSSIVRSYVVIRRNGSVYGRNFFFDSVKNLDNVAVIAVSDGLIVSAEIPVRNHNVVNVDFCTFSCGVVSGEYYSTFCVSSGVCERNAYAGNAVTVIVFVRSLTYERACYISKIFAGCNNDLTGFNACRKSSGDGVSAIFVFGKGYGVSSISDNRFIFRNVNRIYRVNGVNGIYRVNGINRGFFNCAATNGSFNAGSVSFDLVEVNNVSVGAIKLLVSESYAKAHDIGSAGNGYENVKVLIKFFAALFNCVLGSIGNCNKLGSEFSCGVVEAISGGFNSCNLAMTVERTTIKLFENASAADNDSTDGGSIVKCKFNLVFGISTSHFNGNASNAAVAVKSNVACTTVDTVGKNGSAVIGAGTLECVHGVGVTHTSEKVFAICRNEGCTESASYHNHRKNDCEGLRSENFAHFLFLLGLFYFVWSRFSLTKTGRCRH